MARVNKTKTGSEYRVRTKSGKIKGEYDSKSRAKKRARNMKRKK